MDQLNELIECFRAVKDPRVVGRSKHLLIDIIVIAVIGTLCGAEGIKNIWQFAVMKMDWLKNYLKLAEGVPSEDTIARVLSIIDAGQMEKAFLIWVESITADKEQTKSISLDGKYSKGTDRSFNRGTKPLLMVSAYSHELGLSLMESEGIAGSEYVGALACLEVLDLKDILVEMDAGIGSNEIVRKVLEKQGDYLVPIKKNRKLSYNEMVGVFEVRKEEIKKSEVIENNHGRIELRTCRLLEGKELSNSFYEQWPEAKTIFLITRERIEDDKRYVVQDTGADGKVTYKINKNDIKVSEENVFYVSSKKLGVKEALLEARKHWGIENKLHWVLDVAFREDNCAVRAKALARILSLVRKMALNIIRNSATTGSVKGRMKQAGWSNDYLEKLLFTRAV